MQIACDSCTTRTFYIMAQDNGTIQAFCTTHNHPKDIVNIPSLAAEILSAYQGVTGNDEKLEIKLTAINDGSTEVAVRPETNGPDTETVIEDYLNSKHKCP